MKNTLKIISILASTFMLSAPAFAHKSAKHERRKTCVSTKWGLSHAQSEKDEQNKSVWDRLQKGETVDLQYDTESKYKMNVVYKLVDMSPEYVVAVQSQFEEQNEYLGVKQNGKMIEVKVISPIDPDNKVKAATVQYKADPQNSMVPEGEYTEYRTRERLYNPIKKKYYLLKWSLVHNSSPGWLGLEHMSGFTKSEDYKNKALVTRCEYVLPRTKLQTRKVNRQTREGVKDSVERLIGYAQKQADAGKEKEYISKYRSYWKH